MPKFFSEKQARRALYGAGIDEIASELPIGKKKKKVSTQ
jgi:hypothetical protein